MTAQAPHRYLLALAAALLLPGGLAVLAAPPQSTERVSLTSTEAEADGPSDGPVSVSADGRFVAFASGATNLYPLDLSVASDIFVRDRTVGFTDIASLSSARVQANAPCANPSISSDGRYVAFESAAASLVAGDANNAADIFVRDRRGRTVRASVSTLGAEANGASGAAAIAGNASAVAYHSLATNLVVGDTNNARDVFVTQLLTSPTGTTSGLRTGQTVRVSEAVINAVTVEGNGESAFPSISADGRFVAFQSDATNLVPTDTNGKTDIFVKDLGTGRIELASVDSAGLQADDASVLPAISADGRFVAFVSAATNLASGDGNGKFDVFVRDRLLGTTERVSVSASGGDPDDHSGVLVPSGGNPTPGLVTRPAISADGRFVAFQSLATNLVPGDTNGLMDVFVRDRTLGTTTRISVPALGGEADGASDSPAISADGGTVAFRSAATNLVAGDTNGAEDIFVAPVVGGGLPANRPPVPDALAVGPRPGGPIYELDTVVLDASASTDPDGDPLTFLWTQVSGPIVSINAPNSAIASFQAPLVAVSETLVFEVAVSDGVNPPQRARVSVPVNAAPTAVLTGRVTVLQGGSLRPIARASVEVRRSDGQGPPAALTNASGVYTVNGVRIGTNSIRVSAFGWEPVLDTLVFQSGQRVTRNYTLQTPTATLEGSVLLANGAPVVGATVEFLDAAGNVLGADTTDSAGEYRIRDLDRFEVAAGTIVRIRHPEVVDWVAAGVQLTPHVVNRRDFRYGTLQVTVSAAAGVSGAQLRGTRVEILIGGSVVAVNTVTTTRVLLFPNLPAVRVRVRATNPNLTGAIVDTTIPPGPTVQRVTVVMRPRTF